MKEKVRNSCSRIAKCKQFPQYQSIRGEAVFLEIQCILNVSVSRIRISKRIATIDKNVFCNYPKRRNSTRMKSDLAQWPV